MLSDLTPPPDTHKTPQMTITDSYSESSYLAGLTCNMDVRAHIGRSNPPIVTSSGQEWQYDISTVRAHIGRSNPP